MNILEKFIDKYAEEPIRSTELAPLKAMCQHLEDDGTLDDMHLFIYDGLIEVARSKYDARVKVLFFQTFLEYYMDKPTNITKVESKSDVLKEYQLVLLKELTEGTCSTLIHYLIDNIKEEITEQSHNLNIIR